MARHIIGLKRITIWLIAMLVVGVYIPSLVPSNYSSGDENQYCSLERAPAPIPIRVWANEIYDRQEWLAGI